MEAQIVVFLAFASVTFTANTLAIWLAYRAFANATIKVTESVRVFQTSGETRYLLTALETASRQALAMTNAAKDQIAAFDPTLARAQSVYGFGLAKFDVRFEGLCNSISSSAERLQAAIVRSAHKVGAALSGVHTALDLIGGGENETR